MLDADREPRIDPLTGDWSEAPNRRQCGDDWYNPPPEHRPTMSREEIRAREDALSYAFAFVCACAVICLVLVALFG